MTSVSPLFRFQLVFDFRGGFGKKLDSQSSGRFAKSPNPIPNTRPR
jgi:hypothetical protein